jgi:alpha-ketoglutarate-dependent 2,4-dichlorophenoxyacetate dioxygenase
MMLFSGFGLKGLGKFAIAGIQGRLTAMSTKLLFTPGGDRLEKSALAAPLPALQARAVSFDRLMGAGEERRQFHGDARFGSIRRVSLPAGQFCRKLPAIITREDLPMETVPLGPGFAAELRGVTLADVASDDAAYAAVRAAFEEHSVLVLRDQEVTDEIQLAFSRRFGPPEVTKVGSQGTGSHFVILSTIGPDGTVVPPDHRLSLRSKANQLWHTDSSFKRVPALTSILSARVIPARGGETEYVSTRLAFERLDPGLRKKLENSFAWHDYAYSRSQVAADLATPEERAALPPQCWRMVWKNPVNGRGAVYLASHAYAVEGMEAAAGKQLIDELMEAATAPGTSYLHQWGRGDVVMWDNRATMHRGRPWPAHEARLMVRTTISATEADGVATMGLPSSQAAE